MGGGYTLEPIEMRRGGYIGGRWEVRGRRGVRVAWEGPRDISNRAHEILNTGPNAIKNNNKNTDMGGEMSHRKLSRDGRFNGKTFA